MLTGEAGVGRAVKRRPELMKQLNTDDPVAIRAHGGMDLPTVQDCLHHRLMKRVAQPGKIAG